MTLSDLNTFSLYWILIALILLPIQLKIIAPYGRHSNSKWGKMIDNKWGWVMMEAVSFLVFAYFFFIGNTFNAVTLFIAALWLLHYFNRSFIFPFRIKTKGKKMPIMIMLSAIFFNSINASLNAYYLGHFSELYPADWFFDMRFILGLLLFLLGAFINIHSDNILLGLRKEGDTSYSIPMGGGFNYVSCPNLFGEILEWMGFAILCWNLPALTFAIWTAANLIPRAIAHHKWYLQQFPKYPRDRKALVPFLF